MIENELFVTAFIADIHFGSQKSSSLFSQLQKRFLKVIDDKKIDLIVLGGDLFHNIITMNYSTSKYVLLFIERLIELCIKNNIPHIRIIQGTMSHDNNQLKNFHIYENRADIDFKIIYNLSDEILPEGIKILYVPEEYMINPDEYYSPYLSKEKYYDFIFGHGMFKEVAFIAKNQKSEVTMSKAPVFDSKIFINACKGPIYFGHIHIRTDIKKYIFYPGSFSRFRFGEEDDKGWYLNIYDKITHKFAHEFIINDLAPKYTTATVTLDNKIKAEDLSNVINTLLVSNDNVRLKLIIKDNTDSSYIISYLNELYKNNARVKIDIKNEFEFKQEVLMSKAVEKISNKYNFIFDEGISHEEKIQRFIKEKHGKEVPLDVIKDVLNFN